MGIIILIFNLFSLNMAFSLDYKYPSDSRIRINPDLLARCLLAGIKTDPHSFQPRPIYQNSLQPNSLCAYSERTAIAYLSAQKDRCDFQTGNENVLRDWILAQSNNSIDPVSIFKASMRINKNHVFDAILTIHQLLRNEARWRSKKYYRYKSSSSLENQFWNKFIDIRGVNSESEEVDLPGSWFRVWGMFLNRFGTIKDSEIHDSCISNNLFDSNANKAFGLLAELIKYLPISSSYKAGGDRAGKSRTNVAAAQTAESMIEYFGKNNLSKDEQKSCLDRKYLIHDFKFSPTIPLLNSKKK